MEFDRIANHRKIAKQYIYVSWHDGMMECYRIVDDLDLTESPMIYIFTRQYIHRFHGMME